MAEKTLWRPANVASALELEIQPPALSPAEAQAWCNFVLWMPTALPEGCEMTVGTVRREAPPGRIEGVTAGRSPWSDVNPAAYRYEISGPGRRLRVKQFLYDWAFPALDHPCLWGSKTSAVPLGSHVLWFGTDYMKNRAASARLARTTIELSVLEGDFPDSEITGLYRSMSPVLPEAADAIARTPFAELSYWARYRDATAMHVPVGLWKFRRPGRANSGRWCTGGPEMASLLKEYRLPVELGGLRLDSAALFRDNAGKTEAEVVYAGGPARGHELRLIVQRAGDGHVTLPAEPEDHPHIEDKVDIGGVQVSLAWTDDRFGPWDGTWADVRSGVEVKLLAGTGSLLDRNWFLSAAGKLIADARP